MRLRAPKPVTDPVTARAVSHDATGANRDITPAGFDYAWDPRFSPTGTKLVFWGYRTGQTQSDVYEINVSGTGFRNVTNSRRPIAPSVQRGLTAGPEAPA